MLMRVIPLQPWTAPAPWLAPVVGAGNGLHDRLGRPLRELRISVTDRCNFRCTYCMPRSVFGPGHRFLPQDRLLDFKAIERAATAFVALGVRKLRLTGGEPLLRKGLPALVERLAALRTPEGRPVDLAMTTNGALLKRMAADLRAAGLGRLTVSLDALDDAVFRRMNDADHPVAVVLAGIDAALAAGFGPIKLNMVVRRGCNDQEIVPLARWCRDRHGPAVQLRCIEYMDVGSSNRWQLDEVLPSDEVLRRVAAHFPLVPVTGEAPGTARRFRYLDGRGELGLISSVTQPFCGDCTRARLSADGRLVTCLFAQGGHDLRPALAAGGTDALQAAIAGAWRGRGDRYSELRAGAPPEGGGPRIEMHYIGG